MNSYTEKDGIDIYEVVKKLVGPITPIGCHATDKDRLENLKVFINVVEEMLVDLERVASYQNRQEISMKVMGIDAHHFLQDMRNYVE